MLVLKATFYRIKTNLHQKMNQDPARVLPGEITKIDQFLMVLTFRLANGRWKNRIANDGIFY